MSGPLAGRALCFKPTRYGGKPVLQAALAYNVPGQGRGLGAPLLLDQSYRVFKQISTRLPIIMDPHEVEVTRLLEFIFQEVDIETGNVLFEARSPDFSSPADSTVSITGTSAVDSWDYMHINSVDKDDEGNYLVSGRHTLALYKISGRDGSLMWQLGGNGSNFSVPESARFGY
ncbi:hypothetical protein RB594_000087 [Gaeumannomyces avenae]